MSQQSMPYQPDPHACAFPVWTNADGRLTYPCPDELWSVHCEVWRKRRQRGETGIVEPFPADHCMFERPREYGIVPFGTTDPRKLRRMHRQRIVGALRGWDHELRQTRDGLRTLARIVHVSVEARMRGETAGAFPFLACVAALSGSVTVDRRRVLA